MNETIFSKDTEDQKIIAKYSNAFYILWIFLFKKKHANPQSTIDDCNKWLESFPKKDNYFAIQI